MAAGVGIAARAQKELTILHTNDTHSCVSPLNPNLADTMIANRGGFIRRAEMVRQERRKCPELLLLDSGDFSQGSPYYNIYKGEVEVGLMNRMGDSGEDRRSRCQCGFKHAFSCERFLVGFEKSHNNNFVPHPPLEHWLLNAKA